MPTTTKKKATDESPVDTGFDLADVDPEHRDRVEALIPPAWLADRYVSRHIEGMLDFEMLDLAREMRHNVLLYGPTGSGKTSLNRAYCASRRLPYMRVEMNGAYDHGSAVGRMMVGKDGLPTYKPGDLWMVIKYGGNGDINELNYGTPRFLASYYGVLDAAQTLFVQETGETIVRHKATLLTASFNPDYAGISKLATSLMNRFAFAYEWGYDAATEETLVSPYSPSLLTVVRKMRETSDIRTDIGTNKMIEFIEIAQRSDNIKFAAAMFAGGFPATERPFVTRLFEPFMSRIQLELNGQVDGEIIVDAASADTGS